MRGPQARGERQPGKRFEIVVDEQCSEAAGRLLCIGERWLAAAIIKNGPEGFVVRLVETVDARLEIVFRDIRAEAGLTSRISGTAILTRRDWHVRGRTLVFHRVLVVEGRRSEQHFRIEGMNPREIQDGV